MNSCNNTSSISQFTVYCTIPSSNNQNLSIFYVISQKVNQFNWRMVYKSNELSVRPNMQEMLNQFEISTQVFCSTNTHQEDKIDIYSVANLTLVGIGHFHMFDLTNNARNKQYTMIPIANLDGKNTGSILIQYTEQPKMTFIDYLKYGMEIDLIIAIDYSASNQDPISLIQTIM